MDLETFAREQLMEMTAEFVMLRDTKQEPSQGFKTAPRIWFLNGDHLKTDVGPVLAPLFDDGSGKDMMGAMFHKALRSGLVDAVVMLVEAWSAQLDKDEAQEYDMSKGVRLHPKRQECIMAQIIELDRTRGYMQRFLNGRPDGDVIDMNSHGGRTESRFDPPREEQKHA